MPLTPTLQGKTARFHLTSVDVIDQQLRKLRRSRERCYRGVAGYPLSLAGAYTADLDLLLDARNALTNAPSLV